MNVEQIQEEMKKISENHNLTNEEKSARIKIYQTILESTIQESNYKEQMKQFIQGANEMINVSGGLFQIENSLEYNKISLKGNILESDLVKNLNEKGIENFTLEDLTTFHIPSYEQEYGVNLIETKLAISLYEKIENIEKVKQKQMEIISKNLGDLLGKDIFSKISESSTIQSEVQLQENYHKAIMVIEKLYGNEGILDLQTKNATIQLLNQLFNYYINGNGKISLNIF